ncbi:hypothetical protein [Micromonospora aurantiaca]|uniref:Uncharacterized protein n=1 Tax=Micromonospora aurantiaca (nom. illeg.) TaxID=47850 RepID=A0A6N3JX18_9ACTN|nr:hypothetical protein [Micromonospora aurantiaca]AXH89409.1 hypothetical protein DVH21_05355 [Micromonospora aurantiaca]
MPRNVDPSPENTRTDRHRWFTLSVVFNSRPRDTNVNDPEIVCAASGGDTNCTTSAVEVFATDPDTVSVADPCTAASVRRTASAVDDQPASNAGDWAGTVEAT